MGIAATGLRQMCLNHNSRIHRAHIGDTPGVFGFVYQGGLCYKVPQDLFYARLLLSKPGNIETRKHDHLNT